MIKQMKYVNLSDKKNELFLSIDATCLPANILKRNNLIVLKLAQSLQQYYLYILHEMDLHLV